MKTYDRWVGICTLDGQDIAAIAVSEGHGRDCSKFSRGRYEQYEPEASRRIKVVGHGAGDHDLTHPIAWLSGVEN